MFACEDWRPLAHIAVGTSDLEGMAWAPNGTCIAAWDTPLQYCLVRLRPGPDTS